MFHVNTMLPWSSTDVKQIERKRHIGNDVTVLFFVQKGSKFDPRVLTSEFNRIQKKISKKKFREKKNYKLNFSEISRK
jgi:hypothetical protein